MFIVFLAIRSIAVDTFGSFRFLFIIIIIIIIINTIIIMGVFITFD